MHTEELTNYLRGLRATNEKAWFEAHRPEYETLRQEFLALTAAILRQAAGFGGLEGDRLKTAPRGFPADHPAAEYLKFKDFTVGRAEAASAVREPLDEYIVSRLSQLQPFAGFIRRAIS